MAENPEDDAAWYYIAQCAIAKNDAEMAEQALRMASEIDPDNFWYRYRLARLYSLTSRQELTVDMYEKLLEDFPKKSELYFDLVEMYASQREYEKALDTLKEIETVFGMTESIAVYRFNLLRMLNRQEEVRPKKRKRKLKRSFLRRCQKHTHYLENILNMKACLIHLI